MASGLVPGFFAEFILSVAEGLRMTIRALLLMKLFLRHDTSGRLNQNRACARPPIIYLRRLRVRRLVNARDDEYGRPMRTGPSNNAAKGLALRKIMSCATTSAKMAIATRLRTDAVALRKSFARAVG